MSGNPDRPREPRPDVADGTAPLAEHAAGLYRYVRFLVGHSPYVEDIVQETMVRALDSIDRYDPQRPLRAWLNGIALHVTHKYWRRIRRARAAERFEQASGTSTNAAGRDPERELLLRERADLLHRALDTLPASLREALILHAAANGGDHIELAAYLVAHLLYAVGLFDPISEQLVWILPAVGDAQWDIGQKSGKSRG
ncbi:MAG: RNA polymerase sigma factor [Myxococcales bacterium]|nr:RNA polymerase sigma factor [Myxococcales bacterium]